MDWYWCMSKCEFDCIGQCYTHLRTLTMLIASYYPPDSPLTTLPHKPQTNIKPSRRSMAEALRAGIAWPVVVRTAAEAVQLRRCRF